MRLTPNQRRCFDAGKRVCLDLLPKLEWLERVAETAPQYKDEVRELLDLRDHLLALCECGLATADAMG